MRTAATVPYLLPPDRAVEPGPWTDATGAELGDRIEHWDPFTVLELSRSTAVDLDLVRDRCQLGPDSTLALTTSWHATATRLSDGPAPVELSTLTGPVQADLALTVPGDRVGGRVDLRTRLILRHPGSHPTVISPRIPGTILWTDEHRVAVEGSAARFPVSAVDFTSSAAFPNGAGWALEWETHDLHAPLLGALRLLINDSQPSLVAALRSGSTDPRAAATRSFITYDVARTMLDVALRSEDFLAAPFGYDDGTIGRTIADLLSACLPGTDPRTAAALCADNPARFNAAIQHHLGTTT